MKNTRYWIGMSLLAMLMFGCSHAEWNDYQLFPDAYTYDVPYDSIYHYGYNQGCETALYTKGVTNTQYLKDIALENSDTNYNAGWNAGNKACNGGKQVIMSSSWIIPSSPVHEHVTY